MKSGSKKRVVVSVTNDLVCDNRVGKVCETLANMGFDVVLAGRKYKKSQPLPLLKYSTVRFRLLFNKGPLFYLFFNCRLFCFLLFSRFDVLLSNDLDTLPANFVVSRIRRKPLVYDSHEYYTESPELTERPTIRHIWEMLERNMVPHIQFAYTVCESIAEIYTNKYNTLFHVVRNVPRGKDIYSVHNEDNIISSRIILYQGALNMGRGIRQAILSMRYIDDAWLYIAGDGYMKDELENLVLNEDLGSKVKFLGRLSPEKLNKITPEAAVGISIEEDIGLNYHYALPNKLFDYIQSLVPVLVTDLPEMADLVRRYDIGLVTCSLEPEKLAEKFKMMLDDKIARGRWIQNLRKAASDLTWENEEKIVINIFEQFLGNQKYP